MEDVSHEIVAVTRHHGGRFEDPTRTEKVVGSYCVLVDQCCYCAARGAGHSNARRDCPPALEETGCGRSWCEIPFKCAGERASLHELLNTYSESLKLLVQQFGV